ncbi:MAG: hypothetical protein M1820_000879 [Bogoriella megaspora]|nr:MAG: hypothetical protein M1820_000879 [Bogoriella megaspora]
MNKAAEQALGSLLPTVNTPPERLVNLATSLLAQSRSKAGTLKPEEEIARLKQPLDLPQIQPRPPCPPRIYKKLFQFLNNALPAQEPRTPTKPKPTPAAGSAATPASTRSQRNQVTPQATPTKAPSSKPSTARKRKLNDVSGNDGGEDVPPWVMPTIRHICKMLHAPAAVPHVYAGLSSVLGKVDWQNLARPALSEAPTTPSRSAKRKRNAEVKEADNIHGKDTVVAALVIVIHLYAMVRLSPSEISPEDYVGSKTRAAAALREYHPLEDVSEEVLDQLVEDFLREAQTGWLEWEWFNNIPEGQGLTNTSAFAAMMDGVEDNGAGEASQATEGARNTTTLHSGADTLQHGLGSMFVDAVDYLSEERRRDYVRWKADTMRRIEAMESQAIDTTTG